MRIKTSIHGRLFGLATDDRALSVNGFVSGDDGSQFFHPAPSLVVVNEDFLGLTLNSNQWHATKGSDAACANYAITASVIDGVITGTMGANAGVSMATNGLQLDSGLQWKIGQAGKITRLFAEARLQMASPSTTALFFGFTNQVASLQIPIMSSGSGISQTVNATDCAGFLSDSADTSADWISAASNNSVGATPTDLGATYAPVASTFQTLRVELDASGNVSYYINGHTVGGGPIAGGPRASQFLTPVIASFTRSAVAQNVLVDYIAVGALRV